MNLELRRSRSRALLVLVSSALLAPACSTEEAAVPSSTTATPARDGGGDAPNRAIDAGGDATAPSPLSDAGVEGVDAAATTAVTFTNFDDGMKQITRFDVEGNAIDAHDGGLYLFDGTYYLYGTSYDCGYLYRLNSSFCGFKVYSSPDLVHFTDRGFVVPPQTCQYCFRPHVIHDVARNRFVLWVNSGGGTGDVAGGPYSVFTSPTPIGRFSRVGSPALNRPSGIDFNVYVDDDAAHTGYLLHNDTNSPLNNGGIADLVVEKLADDYTAPLLGAGNYVELGLTDVESMSAFRRNGTYYLTMSDPTCAYCNTNTGYVTATSMLGPWNGITTLTPPGLNQNGAPEATPNRRSILISGIPERRQDSDSCETQATHVISLPLKGGGTTHLFMGDQWDNRAPNESLANYFWGPLSFAADGSLEKLACPKTVTLDLAVVARGSVIDPPDLDVSSGAARFRSYCDIAGNVARLQTFTATRSGTLTRAALTSFRRGTPGAPGDTPNQPLVVEIVDAATPAGPALATQSVPAETFGWSPRNVVVNPNIPVTAGHVYAIRARSATTKGCYGWMYDDANPYAGGSERFRTNDGASYTEEPARDVKFWTAVR